MRFLLGLLGIGFAGSAFAGAGPIDKCLTSDGPTIVREGMVPFGDGEMFLWNGDGQAQIRRKGGGWTPVFQAADGSVYKVAGDEAGILLARHRPGNEVVLLGTDGKQKDHWLIDAGPMVSLFSQSGRRWVVTDKVLIPLLPQSKLGASQPLPATFTSLTPPVPVPELLRVDSGLLLCIERSFLALTGYGPGICERTGPAGWRAAHWYRSPNLLCGKWIVQMDERRVAVRSAETGKLEKERRFSVKPEVACAGEDKVAVGERTLDLLSLPTLATVLKRRTPLGRVREVTFVDGDIAFSREGQKGIHFLSLSCAVTGGGSPHE
jgi:hypothetical protein